MAKLSSLVVDLQVESAALRKGLDDANKKLEAFGAKVDKVAKGVALAFGAKLAKDAALALAGFVQHGAEVADQMGKMAQSTGVSVEALSGLSYAAKLSDVSTEDLGTSLNHLNKNLAAAAGGGKEQSAAFKALGISVRDSSGNVRGAGDVMGELADKFRGMEDGAGKAALAQELFGKSGARLIPLLNQGRDGIAEMTAEAQTFGLVITAETAAAAEEFNDNLTRLHSMADGVAVQLAANLSPSLNALVGEFIRATQAGGGMKDVVEFIATGLRGIVTAGDAVVSTLRTIATTVGAVASKLASMDWGGFGKKGSIAKQLSEDIGFGSEVSDIWSGFSSRTSATWNTSQAPAALGPEFRPGQTMPKTKAPIINRGAGTAAKEKQAWAEGNKYREQQAKRERDIAEARIAADREISDVIDSLNDKAKELNKELAKKTAAYLADKGEQLVGGLGGAGTVLQDVMSGDLIGALIDLLQMAEQWAGLIDALNGILQPVANVLGVYLEPLIAPLEIAGKFLQAIEPALQLFLRMGLLATQPLMILGQAVLPLLQEGLKYVSFVILKIAEGIAWAWNTILETVAGILDGVATALGPIGEPVRLLVEGIRSLEDKTPYRALADGMLNATDAANENAEANASAASSVRSVAEDISNVPTWFKLSAARLGAADEGLGPLGGLDVNVYVDGQSVASRMQKRMKNESYNSTGSTARWNSITGFH